ncbi:T9SS type A sorting domain-containing protein, partial [candidate division WOR-3 bacterium]|nr:T9SS type A sorting domain-containing protein [candidate division WOR-3 bacterium]
GVQGDEIQLYGSTQRARIISVNYSTKTITVDGNITWAQNQGINLAYEEAAPDIGAYEYQEGVIVEEYPVYVYPNPCRVYMGETFITFDNLNSDDIVKVFDISGKLIHKSGNISGSTYRWNVNNISSGIYFYTIEGNCKITGKVVVIK